MQENTQTILWNHAAINVVDIRRQVLHPNEELHSYRLPSSCFLYAFRGSAQVALDGRKYLAQRFLLLHGGKGMSLEISLVEEAFEFFLIFYKASISLPYSEEVRRLMERGNPFQEPYGFLPEEPVAILESADRMEQEWQRCE